MGHVAVPGQDHRRLDRLRPDRGRLTTGRRPAGHRLPSRRADGTWRRRLPIWVVSVEGQVYVRTWQRRDSGWFGDVVHSHQARIRVPGVEADVAVEDVGVGTPQLRADIDAAYRAKYGRLGGVEGMVTDGAAAATLRLNRSRPAR